MLGLASIIAIAFAVPALGGPSNPIASSAASAKKLANKALKKAKAANAAAVTAQSTADSAQAAANAAQSTANAAQATADSAQSTANTAISTKFDTVVNVEGDPSPNNSIDKSVIFATCPGAQPTPTGGGFFINGAGSVEAITNFNTAYIGSWAVGALANGDSGSNWTLTPTARCIGT
ncbi:MAG: hypothetical protein FJW90_12840 [Actinobacteria bacterium]|nr:hypothetical protein [Actinomycetota bacterium]